MSEYLLQVKDLHTSFFTDSGEVKAVNGVSFNLEAGKTLGIVGESGSGKSVTAYSIMQILADTGKIVSGEVLYKGEDITKWNKKTDAGISWKEMFHYLPGSDDQLKSGIYHRKPADGSDSAPHGP